MEFPGRVSCSEEGRGKNFFSAAAMFAGLHVTLGTVMGFKLIRAGKRLGKWSNVHWLPIEQLPHHWAYVR